MNTKLFLLAFLLIQFINAQDTTGYSELANYPFTSDTSDSTGNFPNATNINGNFQNGGLNTVIVYTPNISTFDTNDFIVKIDFKPNQIINQPVFICGRYYRWLEISINYIDATTGYALTYSGFYQDGSYFTGTTNFTNLTSNTWYTLGIKYQQSTQNFDFFINDNAIGSFHATAPIGFHNEYTFTNVDNGSNLSFAGYYRNLIIYGSTAGLENQSALGLKIYPVPAKGIVNISSQKQEIKQVYLYDATGRNIYRPNGLVDDIQIKDIKPGIYLLKIKLKDNTVFTKKIISQ